MRPASFLALRVLAGVGVIMGILALVSTAWWTRGLGEATALFQLLQGVLLGTIGFVWGSHTVERLAAQAEEESERRRVVEARSLAAQEDAARMERDLATLLVLARRLHNDPVLRRKVEELAGPLEVP